MALAPWINPPNYLHAIQAGAQLGAQLRQQRFAEEQAASRLQLSFAEQALRQQAQQDAAARHAAELALRNNELLMRRDNNAENLMLKGQLEEGRNIRAADALTAQNQRNADALALRKELGVAGNEIKREVETGKNQRAEAFRELRRSLSDDSNEIKRESNDIRRDSLEWQQEKFWEELEAKESRLSEKLNPYDSKILSESLKSIRAKYKDDPFEAAGQAAKLLRAYDPRNKETPQTSTKRFRWNGKSIAPVE